MSKKTELQAKAEELGIATKNEDGKELTIAELEAAIEEKENEGGDEPQTNDPEVPAEETEVVDAEEVKPKVVGKGPKVKTYTEELEDLTYQINKFINTGKGLEALKAKLRELGEEDDSEE